MTDLSFKELIREIEDTEKRPLCDYSKARIAEVVADREAAVGRLTPDEQTVVDKLAEAWNLFDALAIQHPTEKHEMMHAIHTAQNIILARPFERARLRD